MAVKIKLMRLGKMRAPYYRIVVADARTKREGRVIETIGKYHPKEDPSFMEVDGERAAYWLGVGAQPTDPVAAILKVTGDWQKFQDLPAPPPMLVAEPKVDKRTAFEAAARESIQAGGGATTAKKKAAPKVVASNDTAPAGHAAPPVDATATPAPAASDAGPDVSTTPDAATTPDASTIPDTGAVQAPTADPPGADTPAVDTPAVDTPAADPPGADAPGAEDVPTEAPDADSADKA